MPPGHRVTPLGRHGSLTRLTLTRLAIAGLLACVAAVPCAAQDVGSRCVESHASSRPEPHRFALYAVAGMEPAAGRAELLPVSTPFGVAVTEAGVERYRLVVDLCGLRAAPRDSAYVAWIASLSFDSVVSLGTVRNGRTDLGEIARSRFRLVISMEPRALLRTRTGRPLVRGTSPVSLLLAHRDIVQPLARPAAVGEDPHAAHAATWPMPPMRPGMAAMPSLSGLVPRVSPAARPDASALPPAMRPRIRPLRNGDTLRLVTGAVRLPVAGGIAAYAFDGSVPGPRIEVEQGSEVVVRFVNGTDLPSSVHWHGVRVENRFDGVPGMTQELVAPGDSFTYRLRFRDAGLFWYHPHHREDVQQDLGLYGTIVVHPAGAADTLTSDRRQTLVLDDILAGDDGAYPHGREAPTHAVMGRFGNRLLLNGRVRDTIAADRGDVVRFYVTNAASARTFNLSFGGLPIRVIGSDLGRFEGPAEGRSVAIAPAERYIVEVRFPDAGPVVLENRVQAVDHMTGALREERDTVGIVRVSPGRTKQRAPRNAADAPVDASDRIDAGRLAGYLRRPVDRRLTIGMRTRDLPLAVTGMLSGIALPVDWADGLGMINWLTTARDVTWILRDDATGAENAAIDWRFTEGETIVVGIHNDPAGGHGMAHPIHMHGQRFVVLRRNGVANAYPVWKDTALVPAGERVDILVEMSNPGRWMLQCHIAEHLGSGMMMHFTVDSLTSRSRR